MHSLLQAPRARHFGPCSTYCPVGRAPDAYEDSCEEPGLTRGWGFRDVERLNNPGQ